MDWQQLIYFQKLASMQNFTKAAEELALTQPALSRSIARLEEDLGVPLFERKVRGVTLNRYGETFLAHANRAIEEISLARQELKDMIDPDHGHVSLAFIHTLGSSYVPDLIGAFRTKYPNIKFQLSQDSTQHILSQLDSGEIDIGFCTPKESHEYIQSNPIIHEELFLIVPKQHRLAEKQSAELKEVAEDSFVIYKRESGLREVIDGLCHEAGFSPNISFEGVGDDTIAGLVGAGFGVALIPYIPGLDLSKISILRVTKPTCRRIIYMSWHSARYLSPAVNRFKSFMEHDWRVDG